MGDDDRFAGEGLGQLAGKPLGRMSVPALGDIGRQRNGTSIGHATDTRAEVGNMVRCIHLRPGLLCLVVPRKQRKIGPQRGPQEADAPQHMPRLFEENHVRPGSRRAHRCGSGFNLATVELVVSCHIDHRKRRETFERPGDSGRSFCNVPGEYHRIGIRRNIDGAGPGFEVQIGKHKEVHFFPSRTCR